MALRCNICSEEVQEDMLEKHLDSAAHKENKAKIAGMTTAGSDDSVVKAWHESLKDQ